MVSSFLEVGGMYARFAFVKRVFARRLSSRRFQSCTLFRQVEQKLCRMFVT
jgi:hypothetical protein